MNILSNTFEAELDRFVLEVEPVVKEFEHFFDQKVTVPVLIDPLNEVDMAATASDHSAKYYDLAEASKDDYGLVARSLANYDAYILDNIDKISDGPQKEDFEELVRFMLKREDDFSVSENIAVSFSGKKIGARCSEIPGYLVGKSTYTLYLSIPAPGRQQRS